MLDIKSKPVHNTYVSDTAVVEHGVIGVHWDTCDGVQWDNKIWEHFVKIKMEECKLTGFFVCPHAP